MLKSKRAKLLILISALFAVGVAVVLVVNYKSRDTRLLWKGQKSLEARDWERACEYLRAALKKNPQLMEAREELIRAFVMGRQFDNALAEIDSAVKAGMDQTTADMRHATVLAERGMQRVRLAGTPVQPALCDSVINDDINPALNLLKKHVQDTESAAGVFSAIGDIMVRSADVLGVKYGQLNRDLNEAIKLDRKDTLMELRSGLRETKSAIALARTKALDAYEKATALNPTDFRPRIARAALLLSARVPEIEKARNDLEQIVAKEPDNRIVRLLLTQIERMAGNNERALEHIQVLRKSRPDDVRVMTEEVDVLSRLDRWDDASRIVDQLLEKKPKNRLAMYWKGKVLLHADRAEAAASLLQNLFSSPDSHWAEARYMLALALKGKGNREQAIDAFQRVLQDMGQELGTNAFRRNEQRELQYVTCVMLAKELRAVGSSSSEKYAESAFRLFPMREEALQVLRETYEGSESGRKKIDAFVLRHAAALMIMEGPDSAIEVLKKELPAASDKEGMRRQIAWFLKRKGAFREAIAAYEELRHDFPTRRLFAYELADLYARLGQYGEARKVYEELLQSNPKESRAVVALANIISRSGTLDEQRAFVENAAKSNNSVAIRSMLINLYLREKRVDDAIVLANEYVNTQPSNPAARVLMAEVLYGTGKLKEARDVYDFALTIDANYLPCYGRGLLDLQMGKVADALSLYQQGVERFPKSRVLRVEYAVALQANGAAGDALRLLEELLNGQDRPNTALDSLRWALAVLYAQRGDLMKAITQNRLIFTSDLGYYSDRQALLERLAGSDEMIREKAGVSLNLLPLFLEAKMIVPYQENIRAIAALLPDEPLPDTWSAKMLAAQGKHEEAVLGYQKIINKRPDFVLARLLLADSYVQKGESEKAKKVLKDGLDIGGAETRGRINLLLAKIYRDEDDIESALASYEAAMEDPRTAWRACNESAWLLTVKRNDLAAALPLALRAIELGGRQPQLLDTLGWIYYLSGDAEKAVDLLEKAKLGLTAVPTVRYHLGMAYLNAGRTEDAKAELEEALAISGDFPEVEEAETALKNL